ncbi:MAG: hypothetical protein CO088_02635 [Candidatus Yonathbacteria bacterium CG_4_9_14_0_8_um_filter_46_47]|uniref:Uncharacterized protein n=2 Tax=Parcubacteria group TaxID=1794811 RepID=A0A2M8D735_9BACT|nr:MAG: hypothetical protein AUJ44_01310 [Candidatus Nomurabacteria bacterium CG1_02_47_685]PIY57644.1 MAG: hypothetical protein COY99_02065 [Candidatus Yonathbacteria bacterium CG_4_10_14_0_8_um_filter_47_645]PJB82915.1 MAG: hypothetical protein CO088_02635 [Candidatus Yonathbacteria bacterium CG_4_9_14_0_8_um_filter_46_47]PJC21165.1 MAG: hypothetical protein CO061_00220 [Candidatus Yonathbacteria bacterium CG_4_9_14_0_2_um_filter_47_74]PJC67647.1 MAG: hypothetical protein CO016_00810 [Candida
MSGFSVLDVWKYDIVGGGIADAFVIVFGACFRGCASARIKKQRNLVIPVRFEKERISTAYPIRTVHTLVRNS